MQPKPLVVVESRYIVMVGEVSAWPDLPACHALPRYCFSGWRLCGFVYSLLKGKCISHVTIKYPGLGLSILKCHAWKRNCLTRAVESLRRNLKPISQSGHCPLPSSWMFHFRGSRNEPLIKVVLFSVQIYVLSYSMLQAPLSKLSTGSKSIRPEVVTTAVRQYWQC